MAGPILQFILMWFTVLATVAGFITSRGQQPEDLKLMWAPGINWTVHLTLLGKDFFGGKKKALCQQFKKQTKKPQCIKRMIKAVIKWKSVNWRKYMQNKCLRNLNATLRLIKITTKTQCFPVFFIQLSDKCVTHEDFFLV